MGSIILPAIGIAIAVALLGSVGFQILTPAEEISPFLALEEKCEKIALEGYEMHLKYPDSQPDNMPEGDRNRLLYIDDLWISECVNGLPADVLFDIVNRVELDYRGFGE